MASNSKRQQTMAKFAREQKIKERRALKQDKRAAARSAKAAGEAPVAHPVDDEQGAAEPSA